MQPRTTVAMTAHAYLEVKRTVNTIFLRSEDGSKMLRHGGAAAKLHSITLKTASQVTLKHGENSKTLKDFVTKQKPDERRLNTDQSRLEHPEPKHMKDGFARAARVC